ncbi:MAG: hypothetical protein MUO76_00680, partial [Anaerolineaceae bacterium]|nr:hypothetical protein [Anaerolineaceae bacterium]
SSVKQKNSTNDLLWFNGIELDGRDDLGSAYHIVCLGSFGEMDPEIGLLAALESLRKQNAFVILAHPFWMGNTMDDVLRYDFDAVEIYNHACRWLNGKGDGTVYWNRMLGKKPNMLAIASDDSHFLTEPPVWNGGWVMVNAAEKSHEAILCALRSGNYYSSCGPEIISLEKHANTVTVNTSPVQFVRLVGPGSSGDRMGSFEGEPITSATFELPTDWGYVFIEIEDCNQQRAWTNNLFRYDK